MNHIASSINSERTNRVDLTVIPYCGGMIVNMLLPLLVGISMNVATTFKIMITMIA